MVQIKAGTKLFSAVCDTQIMVLRVPADDLDVTCGGLPMQTEEAAEKSVSEDAAGSSESASEEHDQTSREDENVEEKFSRNFRVNGEMREKIM